MQELKEFRDGCNAFINGSGFDLLKEGLEAKRHEEACHGPKSSAANLPDLSLDCEPINTVASARDSGRVASDPQRLNALLDWKKNWGEEGDKFARNQVVAENLRPSNLLQVAKDLAECGEKYGPAISADAAAVIASRGRNIPADLKLCKDLIVFARSPEAAKLSEDAKKLFDRSRDKLGLLQ